MQFQGVSFKFPSYVPPVTAWLKHGPFAHWLVNAQRPRRVVELGTHYGYSYFCFCEAIQANGIEADCFAVDTWAGDEHSGFYGDEVYQAVVAENRKYARFSSLLRKSFSEALADIPDGTVDLLHVDGRHYYEDVSEDFASWIPKLSKSAVVLFHDTKVRERDFGIWKYWEEISEGRTALNLPYQHGLGVLFWGEQPPQELANFVAAVNCPTARPLLIDHFSSVGEAFLRERERTDYSNAELGRLSREVELRNAATESIGIELSLAQSEIAHLRAATESLREERSLLETSVHDKQKKIESLANKLNVVEGLLRQARINPLYQFARLSGFRFLLLVRSSAKIFSIGSASLDQLILQLDPERKEHLEGATAVDRVTGS